MATAHAIYILPPANLQPLIKRLKEADRLKRQTSAARFLSPRIASALQQASQGWAGSGPFAKGWLATQDGPGILVTNNAPAAKFIEERTKPHDIFPTRGKFLAWIPGRGAFSAFKVSASTKSGAGWVYAKKVHHPGTAGKYVFPKTIEAISDEIFEALGAEDINYLKGSAVA